MDRQEIRERLLLIARNRLGNMPGAFRQFRYTIDNTVQGVALIAAAQAMPYVWDVSEQMGDSKATEQIREHLTRIVDRWEQSRAPPSAVEPLPGAALPSIVPATSEARNTETQEERQARRYQLCIDRGLQMPDTDYATLPRGIGDIARELGISRQALSEDLKAFIRRRTAASR